MSKRKLRLKNNHDKALNRRNLIIASIVGITVILTFLIELPQKISATFDVFRSTETPTLQSINATIPSPSEKILVTIFCTSRVTFKIIDTSKNKQIVELTCLASQAEQTIYLPPGDYRYEYTYWQSDTCPTGATCSPGWIPIQTQSGNFTAFSGKIILNQLNDELQLITSP